MTISKTAMTVGRDWDEDIVIILNAYRARKQKNEISPFELLFCKQCQWNPPSISNLRCWSRDPAKEDDRVAQLARAIPQRSGIICVAGQEEDRFQKGDQVMVRRPRNRRAMETKWYGPYEVILMTHPT